MKITEKSFEVLNAIKSAGGRMSVADLAVALDRTERSVGANITDLSKKGLAVREKVEVEGAEKPVTCAVLTDDGMTFVPSED